MELFDKEMFNAPRKRNDRDTLIVVFLVLSMNNKFYEINEINILSALIAQRNDCSFLHLTH